MRIVIPLRDRLPHLGRLAFDLAHRLDESILAATALDNLTGPLKKAWVINEVLVTFDALWPAVPFPLWLAWAKPLIQPAARRLTARVLDGALEWLYLRYHKSPSTALRAE